MRNIHLSAILLLASLPCLGQTTGSIIEPATNWTLIYYMGKTSIPNQAVKVTNTGSSCSGYLSFASSATLDEVKEFFRLATASKLSGNSIKVNYSDPQGICTITSFGPQ